VETLCGYFTQYLYMPRVRDHEVVRTAIRQLSEVLLPEQDGFAYADSVDEHGRYRGLTLKAPPVVSGSGLVVDPRVAVEQIEEEAAAAAGAAGPAGGGGETPSGLGGGTVGVPGGVSSKAGPPGTGAAAAKPTRFHATKQLDSGRPVRDISQISDEIITPLFLGTGAQVRITVDIESNALDKLTPEQVTALKENLATLGFTDWNIE